jgi:RNA polymerase sigma factor (sigma-70 family)
MTDTPAHFRTTQWSLVLMAPRSDSTWSRQALETLCRTYWPPIYWFVRRRGYTPDDARDLTQEFFTRLIEKQALGQVDPAKGKFRSFLLASMKHFLANEWDKANAQKRGGGKALFSIDDGSLETASHNEPVDEQTPEKTFQRRWAITVLNQVLQLLHDEHAADGKIDLFEQLKPVLTGNGGDDGYAQVAQRLGMSDTAVKTAAFRLRKRYGHLLREQIAQTVADPAEIEDELRDLFSAFQ